MNIYFACSITGGRELEAVYQQMVTALESDGHIIPTSHLAQAEAMQGERALTPQDVYQRDVNWIRACDALIAEVSVPSHGVGYDIGFGLNIGKPVLCLYSEERRFSKMITGNADPALTVRSYATLDEALLLMHDFLNGT